MRKVNPMVYTGLNTIHKSMVRYNITKVNVDQVIIAVYTVMEVARADLLSKKRSRPIADARAILCLMLRDIIGMTYQHIGKIVGRDHSTVMYLIEQARNWMEVDKSIANKVSQINELLR